MSRNSSSEEPSWLDGSISSINIMQEESEGLDNNAYDIEDEVESEIEEDESVDMEFDSDWEEQLGEYEVVENNNRCTISNLDDILSLDLKNLSPYDAKDVVFSSLEVAYLFYYWFARFNGFAARKSRVLKNKKGEVSQQSFVCYRQGFREDRGLSMDNRKRYVKPETRCGCLAKLTVHVDENCGYWYITYFYDDHNHEPLKERHCRMVATHRTMTESDVLHLNNLRAVGISTPHIYGSLAYQAGGYDRVGFRRKDVYNQSGTQRKKKNVDAKGALQYLYTLQEKDPMMLFRYTVDEKNRLQHLFWCDGLMQMDYNIFGDVLAFDATYGKYKYECPLVIFSGVNHHNHTTVFAAAVVANEKEETYVWLLEQFLEAMKGKSPVSVITDGDVAMRNSIRRVFPNAHHRLCAWHLLRNATTNISKPSFTSEFRKCMLGEYEIGEFKRKWRELISKFKLEDHPWVLELYEKRKMWCATYIRGSFFGGFRTTSRCEALHSQISKFVYSRYNLTELLQHFHRCLNLMRHRECEADFESIHGVAVLRTHFRNLERFASNVFTKEMFDLFRKELERAGLVRVVRCKESFDYLIYTIEKYDLSKRTWHVSFKPSIQQFKCSCRMMESVGIPCVHILGLLVFLNIHELPKSLILKRWTKSVKDDIYNEDMSVNFWGCEKDARYLSLMEHFKQVSVLASESVDAYHNQRDKALIERNLLLSAKGAGTEGNAGSNRDTAGLNVNDPNRVRSKGCGGQMNSSWSRTQKPKVVKKCSTCRKPGHNKRSCPTLSNCPATGGSILDLCDGSEDDVNDSGIHVPGGMGNDDDESAVGVQCYSFEEPAFNNIDDWRP